MENSAKDGTLYVSAIFDCFDAVGLGLAVDPIQHESSIM